MANTISKSSLKDSIITIRCSKSEKAIMEMKAKKLNISTSQYLLDCGIAGNERHRSKDRKRIKRIIEYNEDLNSLFKIMQEIPLDSIPEDLNNCIDILLKKGAEIWPY